MAGTPNYSLNLAPTDDTTAVLIWIQSLMGPDVGSNMMKLDAIIASLEATKANKVVESTDEPDGLAAGDEWDRLL